MPETTIVEMEDYRVVKGPGGALVIAQVDSPKTVEFHDEAARLLEFLVREALAAGLEDDIAWLCEKAIAFAA